ncbi:hypothetical protein Ade02nite_21270 [Paractinoplanes deccanensis]|uniref:Uncharacterized protein n=1 Tax=Paractinoplanes deccanensis TaxID=113561 RepID=A0ABQ3Y0F5_9ACTN|nr:hypothetical protein [Actinoplanes deccanensis]GID73486.1 hypothetical protein Ade02nite_21270 [Actinoplanes deccanensis]
MSEATDWWTPDPDHPDARPNWEPADLEKGHLSEAILLASDGSMRRILRPGSMTVLLTEPSRPVVGDPMPEQQIVVPEGQCRIIQMPAWGVEVSIG